MKSPILRLERIAPLAGILLVGIFVSGCATSGAFNSASLTEVQLSEANYELVATNVTGEATAGYLLGVSGSFYGQVSTIALARVSGTGMLYGEALADLWENFEEEHGSASGRELALVNVRFDVDALNVLIYTQPTVSVRADVVEFSP